MLPPVGAGGLALDLLKARRVEFNQGGWQPPIMVHATVRAGERLGAR